MSRASDLPHMEVAQIRIEQDQEKKNRIWATFACILNVD